MALPLGRMIVEAPVEKYNRPTLLCCSLDRDSNLHVLSVDLSLRLGTSNTLFDCNQYTLSLGGQKSCPNITFPCSLTEDTIDLLWLGERIVGLEFR